MLEVSEPRAQASEQPWHFDAHSHDLVPGRKLDRLDAFGYEVGTPRDGGKPNPLGNLPKLGEEGSYVTLVARTLAPEHVGIQRDEWIAHAATSR